MKKFLMNLLFFAVLGTCSNGFINARGSGAAMGAIFGGALGGLMGGLSHGGKGAAIGLGTGAMTGAMIGSSTSRRHSHHYQPHYVCHRTCGPCHQNVQHVWVDTTDHQDSLYEENDELKSERRYLINKNKELREANRSLNRTLQEYQGVSKFSSQTDDYEYYKSFKRYKKTSNVRKQNAILSDINDELRYQNKKLKQKNNDLKNQIHRFKKHKHKYSLA